MSEDPAGTNRRYLLLSSKFNLERWDHKVRSKIDSELIINSTDYCSHVNVVNKKVQRVNKANRTNRKYRRSTTQYVLFREHPPSGNH